MTSSWTLEHHRRAVEAVIQLGGLSSSKTTLKAVLKLRAEKDRRQGLTRNMVAHHLVGLDWLVVKKKESYRSGSSIKYLVELLLFFFLKNGITFSWNKSIWLKG